MLKRIFSSLLFSALILFGGLDAFAQDGAYSAYTPYTVYGIGDLLPQGSAHSKGMGGVGVATRNKKYINYLNPAAVTARDTLSFMADFGLGMNNRYYKQDDKSSANNILNITNLALSFPIYKSSAMMVGFTPYSSTGYDIGALIPISDDVLSTAGNIVDAWKGQGSISKLFTSAGVTFWNRLSLGVEGQLYFGRISKSYERVVESSSYRGYKAGNTLSLHAVGAKFGMQYEQPMGSVTLGLGATYKTNAKMKGYIENYSDTTYTTDSLKLASSGASIGNEIAVGISLRRGDKWRAEFDYTRGDWSASGFDAINGLKVVSPAGATFKSAISQSFRAGFEITPNVNDIRYYRKRITYRGGAYYETSPYSVQGSQLETIGLTFGATLPVFKLYNGITVGMEVGQRNCPVQGMIKERFLNFSLGFDIHDIWFQKSQYR